MVLERLRPEAAEVQPMGQAELAGLLVRRDSRPVTVVAVAVEAVVAMAMGVLLMEHPLAAHHITAMVTTTKIKVIRTRLTPVEMERITSRVSRVLYVVGAVDRLRLVRPMILKEKAVAAEMTMRPRSSPSSSPKLSRTARNGAVRKAT